MTTQHFCPYCGGSLRPTAKFCNHCGHQITEASSTLPPLPSASQAQLDKRFLRPLIWGCILFTILLSSGVFIWVTHSNTLAQSNVVRSPVVLTPTTLRNRTAVPTLSLAIKPTPLPPLDLGTLRVHFIDVGQGDSTLIQAPDGTTALIDGGYSSSGLLNYLQLQKITRIDVMILSHPHEDHMGGLIDVLKTLPVGGVWTSGATHTTGTFEQFLDAIASAKVPYHEVKLGDTIPLSSLKFTVLHSDPKASNLNDTSMVVRLAYNAISFLFTGDAEQPSESVMIRDLKAQLASTILKVGHHGSYTSSSSAFLTAVAPQIAVYSAGRGNSYGHPHKEAIMNLCKTKITIYGTAIHGTVVVNTDGERYTVYTAVNAPPQPCGQ